MTRITVPRFLRRSLITGVALAGIVAPAAMAGSASAATSWAPRLHPESFYIFESTYDQAGSVEAYGPVDGFGSLQTPGPGLAVLDLAHPYGTVNVRHTPEPAPRINWRDCTETTYQEGYWRFAGGTGHDWGATGHGTFRLEDYAVLKRDRRGCELNAEPRYEQVSVQAEGLAAR